MVASGSNLAYSDAGLLTIQITGAAASVRKIGEEAVKALKSISEGGVSKEDLTKAIAKAKFNALEASQSGISTLLSAGSGIIHTGKPFEIAETVKSIDGVTADNLKTVCVYPLNSMLIVTNEYCRRPRPFSTVRPP